MEVRFYIDGNTGEPHIYEHDVIFEESLYRHTAAAVVGGDEDEQSEFSARLGWRTNETVAFAL